ncbi:hypothetical protein AB1Y20_018028 [Prymnesium parvum]|uniref:Uncharacterized protein n=1 Tax=Prymnesium parvum TaxID=97485 RepID=A0AB34JMV2_PRYPA
MLPLLAGIASAFLVSGGSQRGHSLSPRASFARSPLMQEPVGASSPQGAALIERAREFIHSGSGFYSPADAAMFSEEFVFRGPYIGPLNKVDYIHVMNTFKIYEAVPDISPNAFGFCIDPTDCNRVWFIVRNSGTITGSIGLGNGLSFPPNGKKLQGCPETFSITFDSEKKVKLLTVGYVADRFEGNTQGTGAAVGIFKVAGLPFPPPGPLYALVTGFSNRVMKRILPDLPKTVSDPEDIPRWWPHSERGTEGYE